MHPYTVKVVQATRCQPRNGNPHTALGGPGPEAVETFLRDRSYPFTDVCHLLSHDLLLVKVNSLSLESGEAAYSCTWAWF